MAFQPNRQDPDAVTPAAIEELIYYFDTAPDETRRLLDVGMTITDIKNYKRTLNGCGTSPLQ